MKYKELTLDWDYYMISNITENKENILKLIKICCNNIKVLDTKKGLNLIGDLKKDIDFNELIILRLFCFDDIFRIRNEITKAHQKQLHRVNRIWLSKDGIEKETIFNNSSDNLTIGILDNFILRINSKRPLSNSKKEIVQ